MSIPRARNWALSRCQQQAQILVWYSGSSTTFLLLWNSFSFSFPLACINTVQSSSLLYWMSLNLWKLSALHNPPPPFQTSTTLHLSCMVSTLFSIAWYNDTCTSILSFTLHLCFSVGKRFKGKNKNIFLFHLIQCTCITYRVNFKIRRSSYFVQHHALLSLCSGPSPRYLQFP